MPLFQGECGTRGPPGLPGHHGRKVDELLPLFSAKVLTDWCVYAPFKRVYTHNRFNRYGIYFIIIIIIITDAAVSH